MCFGFLEGLRHKKRHLEPSKTLAKRVFSTSWKVLDAKNAILSRLGAILGYLGPFCGHLGRTSGHLGAILKSLGATRELENSVFAREVCRKWKVEDVKLRLL